MQSQSFTDTTPLVFRPESYVERFDWSRVFPRSAPIEIELGSGDGTFLVEYAARHPERNFFGVERLLGRLRKIDRKAQRRGLANLRVMRIEASYLARYLVPPESVEALHIYFPDPWPKRRHRKNRLIQEPFAEVSRQMLRPGGWIHLRTDDLDYFEQMQRVYTSMRGFRRGETPAELAECVTDFEREFRARGISGFSLSVQRIG